MSKASATDFLEVRWRAQNSDEPWSAPHAVEPAKEIVIEELSRSGNLEFQVRAVSHCGAKSIWVSNDYTVPDPPALPAPGGMVGTGGADGADLGWDNPTAGGMRGDISFEIQRSLSLSGPWTTIAIVRGLNWRDTLTDKQTYYYRVRAIDYRGNYSPWTIISQPVQATSVAADMREAIDEVQQDVEDMNQDVADLESQINVIQGQVGDILSADEWLTTTTYVDGDLVQYNGGLYRSLANDNTGNQPDTSPTQWEYIGDYASLGEAVAANASNITLIDSRVTENDGDITANTTALSYLGAMNGANTAFVLSQSTAEVAPGQTLGEYITSVQSTTDGLDARVDTAETAIVDLDNNKADASALQAVTARMPSGSGDLATEASVNAEQQARIDGDDVNAQELTNVKASLATNPNLCPNPNGAEGPSGGGWSTTAGTLATGDVGYGSYFRFEPISADCRANSGYIPIHGNGYTYTASAEFWGSDDGWLSIYYYDINNDYISGSRTPNADLPGGTVGKDGTGWTSISTTGDSPANAVFAKIYIDSASGSTDNVYFRKVKLELSPNPTIFNDTTSVANSAQVTQSITAHVSAGGDAYAQAMTLVDANGKIGGTRLSSDGSISAFDILADRFSVTPPNNNGARMEWSDNAIKIHDSSNTLRIFIGLE